MYLHNSNKKRLILAKFHISNARQLNCYILVKSANADISYSGFCEVSPRHEVSNIK